MTVRIRSLLVATAAAGLLLATAASAGAAILVRIPNVKGDAKIAGYEGWFVADSFSFGVEREMRESGEKGGTEDINIGVGELQEVTISKSMDMASTALAQFAMNGNSVGTVEIAFVEIGGAGGEGKPVTYLRYQLERAFVKSWSTSGDADDRPTEEVAFYYNRIAFTYSHTTDGKTMESSSAGWDKVMNKPFSLPATKASLQMMRQ
jgi:type VI secretion system Hcp family effector